MPDRQPRVDVLLCLAAPPALAGEDVTGARDHPLLSRYPDSFVTEYSKSCNATGFQVGAMGAPPKVETVEGDTTSLMHFYGSAESQPSPPQVISYYQNAVKAIGGEVP